MPALEQACCVWRRTWLCRELGVVFRWAQFVNQSDSGRGSPRRPVHVPVLLREVLAILNVQPGQIVVDGTVGAAGHSSKIRERLGETGHLLGFDRDPMMLAHARENLPEVGVSLHLGSYCALPEAMVRLGLSSVDAILLDLGLSSDQLADHDRSFSFHATGPLDLRFHAGEGISAADWLAQASEAEIEHVLTEYGDEPAARQIASGLVKHRLSHPIRTGQDFAHAVIAALPSKRVDTAEKHPATRAFQALRIVVNDELGHVARMVQEIAPRCLKAGGALAVITFHSLEDRIVKQALKDSAVWKESGKPITPTPAEIRFNPRSRSAKLRVAIRN